MTAVALACALLIVASTVTHYEVLRLLSFGLPRVRVRQRAKLLVVMFAAFFAHGLEILLYALTAYLLKSGRARHRKE